MELFTLPLLFCGLASGGATLIMAIAIIIWAQRKMTERAAIGYSEDYLSMNAGHRDDNRDVPGWYTTPYIGPDGTVYDQPLTPRPKMGREL